MGSRHFNHMKKEPLSNNNYAVLNLDLSQDGASIHGGGAILRHNND
jgi:hypothetical protein